MTKATSGVPNRKLRGTGRIRYMVTLFYKIAKKTPKLIISISGKSKNWPKDSFAEGEYVHSRSEEWVKLEGTRRSKGFR